MADNTVLNTGAGGDTIATDDIAGVKYQRVKLVLGADGANDGDVSSAVPMPVSGPLTDAQLRASVVPVSLPAGFATSALQGTGNTSLSSIDGKLPALVSGSVPVINAAGTNNIGKVTATQFDASGDTTMQNAAAATGNGTLLTVTGYGTALIQITGTFVATVTFEGTVNGTDFVSVSAVQMGSTSIATTATVPGIYRLTCAALTSVRARISAFTSGTVTAVGRATNSPLAPKVVQVTGHPTALGQTTSASSLPVVIASDQSQINVYTPDLFITGQGSQTTVNNNIILASAGATSTDVSGYKSIGIQIVASSGTFTTGQLTFEGSNDNTNFVSIPLYDTASTTANPISNYAFATSTTRYFRGPISFRYFRARMNIGCSGTNTGVQAFTRLSAESFTPTQFTVTQATGANLNVAVASGTVTTVSTVTSVTAVAASTPVTPTTTFLNAAATTNATSTKASAGTVWCGHLHNFTASAKFFKLYNKASAPTVGTDVPVMVFSVPANSQLQFDGGSNGYRFATGIAFAITGAEPDSDTTAVAAGDVKLAMSWT